MSVRGPGGMAGGSAQARGRWKIGEKQGTGSKCVAAKKGTGKGQCSSAQRDGLFTQHTSVPNA